MKIRSSRFLKSATKLSGCPKTQAAEFAFIGRSNVGKSSLINLLCSNKNLAKTSATPGKTKLINFFLINEDWFLVDLPGYGYAKVAKAQKEIFEKIISDYCRKRERLVNLFVLVDSRLPLQQIDAEFMNWCGENNIPFVIVFTKTDKLTRQQLQKNLTAYRKALSEWWEECPQIMITSAEKAIGREEILEYIFRFKDALN